MAASRRGWQKRFLESLAESFVVTRACRAAGVGRTHVYTTRQKDPEFRAAWDDAVETAIDNIEEAARARVIAGDASDAMTMFFLKSRRGEIYGDRVTVRTEKVEAEAERLAAKLGLDPAEILADAEAMIKDGQ